jgi:alanine dehydrogenase
MLSRSPIKAGKKAMNENSEIKAGANIINGQITYMAGADAFGLEYFSIEDFLR